MQTFSSTPLRQARLLRALEQVWIAVGMLTALSGVLLAGMAVYPSLGVTNSSQTGGSQSQASAIDQLNRKLTLPSGASESVLPKLSPDDTSPALAPASSNQAAPLAPKPVAESDSLSASQAQGTRVLGSSSSGNRTGANAAIESQLGAWLTLDKCQPDLPIFANVRGQWRSASILFVRGSMVMVRFTDPSFSDEECAVSQLRMRSGDQPAQTVAAPQSASSSSSPNPSPSPSPVSKQPLSVPASTSTSATPNPEAKIKSRKMLASDFEPGMCVLVLFRPQPGEKISSYRATVIKPQGEQVLVRRDDTGAQTLLGPLELFAKKSDFVKPASGYKPGEFVYVASIRGNPGGWNGTRVERVEGENIIVVGFSSDVAARTYTASDVRPIKRDDDPVK